MSLASVKKVYDAYAWFYDVVFGRIFHQGRCATTDIVNKNAPQSAQILEVGVGTGLSLPMYRKDLNITGIDVSDKMLEKAQNRVKNLATHIVIKNMDAAHLDLPDHNFDFIVAMYVASVVPDVNAFLNEIVRVCKPQGEIILVNHFASETPSVQFIEKKLSLITDWVGFNSNFSINSIAQYDRLHIIESKKINLFGYWTLLRCIPQQS